MSVAAVVVSHGHARELEALWPALLPQVDEAVVVANVPGSVGAVPEGVRVLHNPRPLGFAANANLGIAATDAEAVVLANPDAVPEDGAVAILRDFLVTRLRAGVVGPQLRYPDGSWQPSRRRFPTVSGTIVRRTPLRLVLRPAERQTAHYHLDERPTEPVEADWMLGGFLLLRRAMLEELGGFDSGFRMYGEDIDLCYRAAQAGWERWYVPAAVVVHGYDRVTDRRFLDRRTLWHWGGILRFVRKHPERLRAL
ncbi:MAG TPA: glycosyltransferase family 2 protein [Gaiellaceae bacterium]|nr:glycosyltransferase family 2 protein [Gaiellaceae bacterium]